MLASLLTCDTTEKIGDRFFGWLWLMIAFVFSLPLVVVVLVLIGAATQHLFFRPLLLGLFEEMLDREDDGDGEKPHHPPARLCRFGCEW